MSGESLTILLIEDNPAHAELVTRVFKDHGVANSVHHLLDGEAALDYLFRRGKYAVPASSPRPDVILLDLRLPRIDGLEVLKEIKTSKSLLEIPVVVLSTSQAEQDVAKAYAYRANSYVVKPVDFAVFTKLVAELGFYWMVWNCHPRAGE